MNRKQLLDLSREHKPILADRFGIVELALFGSFFPDEADDESDVDILVRFETTPNWRQYFDSQTFLEDPLRRCVDMATRNELKGEIRPFVEREAISV